MPKKNTFRPQIKPWIVAAALLALMVVYLYEELRWGTARAQIGHLILEVGVVFALAGVLYALWAQQTRLLKEQSHLLARANAEVVDLRRRLEAVFRLNRISVEADDEREMVGLALQLVVGLTGARGASFVPLDARGHPLPVVHFGEQPEGKLDDLLEYLASPDVHSRCATCTRLEARDACPLLAQFSGQRLQVFCFPLTRGEHRLGMLNLYIPAETFWQPDERGFIQAVADEIALSLDSVRLRQRELTALRQLQQVRAKSGLDGQLTQMLTDVRHALEADFATLLYYELDAKKTARRLVSGTMPEAVTHVVLESLSNVVRADDVLVMDRRVYGQGEARHHISLMAVPLLSQDGEPLGAILVANHRPVAFHPRQLTLLQTVGGQIALVIHNAHLMSELEYKSVLGERTRLAHEIHDGLAQTLGFLKLQIAQLQKALERQDIDVLDRGISLSYQAVAGAYEDVREAIDDLFMNPMEYQFGGWLNAIASEFAENTAIPVAVREAEREVEPPPEVQIQLIRIIQEALSNIRKHAGARQVEISCQQDGDTVLLEIRDDGCGFAPQDVHDTSQHGLRGMRERAELIGADFQILSRPGEGTILSIRWTERQAQV